MSTLPIVMGLVLECLVAGYVSGQRAVFENTYKEQTISAKIRAVSISIHAGGQNQDVYLGEIISKSDGRRLAKLIDVHVGRFTNRSAGAKVTSYAPDASQKKPVL